MKRCAKCDTDKDESEFYENRTNGRPHSYCKDCTGKRALEYYRANREASIAKNKQWRADNPEKFRIAARKSYLRRAFGITQDEYLSLYKKQDGKCAICKTANPGKGKENFAIDHDHKTGKVRALLCTQCNTVLGVIELNPTWLTAAGEYLQKHIEKTEETAIVTCRHGVQKGWHCWQCGGIAVVDA